jgi:vacuolar-type H+-ATPase subunit H
MEDTLKRLLSVEREAEQLVEKKQAEREQIIQQALEQAHKAELDFQATIPKLQASFLEKAEQRAEQSKITLEKLYTDKQQYLGKLAEENQQQALNAAVNLLMQVGKV